MPGAHPARPCSRWGVHGGTDRMLLPRGHAKSPRRAGCSENYITRCGAYDWASTACLLFFRTTFRLSMLSSERPFVSGTAKNTKKKLTSAKKV